MESSFSRSFTRRTCSRATDRSFSRSSFRNCAIVFAMFFSYLPETRFR